MQTPITIVNPVMGVWPKDAPDKQEEISMKLLDKALGVLSGGRLEGWKKVGNILDFGVWYNLAYGKIGMREGAKW